MKKPARVVSVLALGCALAMPRVVAAEELLVFAAASLTDVLNELGHSWETKSKDKVTFNFGSSSDLARQIKAGAPADAFFSADATRMDELEQAGLVDHGERRDVLSNVLVVVIPNASTGEIKTAGELTKLKRIALANPDSVPAGVYAKKYLTAQGLWDEVADKIIATIDVRAALAAVESEAVDAGIVYRTDAAISERVRVAFEVARDQGPRIVYVLAPLKTSRRTSAQSFIQFLTSADAGRVYERFGFIVLVPH